MLLTDLGKQTLIELLQPRTPGRTPVVSASHRCAAGLAKASRPGVLPAYDEPLLRRELSLFRTGTWPATAA